MNRALLKDISLALLALGGLFLFSAVITYFGGITMVGLVGGVRTDYPWRPLSGPMLTAGIVSLVLGLGFFLWRSKQEEIRYSDWKMISTFGFILGGLSLAGAFVAYFHSQLASGGSGFILYRAYPFRNYSLPLFLFGVELLVIGFVAGQRGRRE